MKQLPAYVCELCGKYSIGEEGAEKIREHEKIPIRGICTSLNGLIVSLHPEHYSVFTQNSHPDQDHMVRYSWDNFLKSNLKIYQPYPKDILDSLSKIIDVDKGFLARDLFFGGDGSGPILRESRPLSLAEFNDVSERLRIKHPKLFGKLEFHRILNYRGRN